MEKRDFTDMVIFFCQKVSEMDISQKHKMELLGMITAIEMKHDELVPKWIPVTEALPEKETDVLIFCKDYFECPNYKELILPLKDVCSKWCNGDNDNTLLEFGCVHGHCGTCDVDNQGSWFPKMRIAYLDNNNEWDGDLSNDEIVVAWMPLPEPWRGDR